MKKVGIVLILLAFVGWFWLPEAGAQKVVKIGGLLTTSGAAAHLGQTTLKGAMHNDLVPHRHPFIGEDIP